MNSISPRPAAIRPGQLLLRPPQYPCLGGRALLPGLGTSGKQRVDGRTDVPSFRGRLAVDLLVFAVGRVAAVADWRRVVVGSDGQSQTGSLAVLPVHGTGSAGGQVGPTRGRCVRLGVLMIQGGGFGKY